MRKTMLVALAVAACRSRDPAPETAKTAAAEPISAAEQVVRRQYDAYNRHDLDGFVAVHAPDVRLYRYPDSLVLQGRDSLRALFGRVFAAGPEVHANVDARMAIGDKVIWKETATGMPGGGTNTGIFIWEVHDGLITRITSIR